MHLSFRIGRSTLSQTIPEVCTAIYDVLKDTYLKCPQTKDDWLLIAKQFNDNWQFPNLCGAIDGKHIRIVPPIGAGSHYFNYKGFHSIVLMAVVDADLKFIYVDVGTNGRISDGGIWANCSLRKRLEAGSMNLPDPAPIFEGWNPMPYVFVGDEAFALKSYMMRPYPSRELTEEKRIYNYRHSRARRTSENAFGILSARFRVFFTPIMLEPEKVKGIVLAATTLHNFLRSRRDTRSSYTPDSALDREDIDSGELFQGSWRHENRNASGVISLNAISRNSSVDAKLTRDRFMDYFNGCGAVEWQWNKFH